MNGTFVVAVAASTATSNCGAAPGVALAIRNWPLSVPFKG